MKIEHPARQVFRTSGDEIARSHLMGGVKARKREVGREWPLKQVVLDGSLDCSFTLCLRCDGSARSAA